MGAITGKLPVFRVCGSVLCAAWVALSAGCGHGDRQPAPPAGPASGPTMVKTVTEQASFVLYLPEGWKASEKTEEGYRWVAVRDAKGTSGGTLATGVSPAGEDIVAVAAWFLGKLGRKPGDAEIREAKVSSDKGRMLFSGSYVEGGKKKDFRGWASVKGDEFTYVLIEAPTGKLEEQKAVLLTTMTHLRTTKGSFEIKRPEVVQVAALKERKLPDGSASFKIPGDWTCQNLGKGGFIAGDAKEECGFMVASVSILTPQGGAGVRGVPVMPYLKPSEGFARLAQSQGLARNVRFVEVTNLEEFAREIRKVYTAGPVLTEGFLYTFTDTKGRKCKGYSLGISYGSNLGLSWSLWHMTVTSAEEKFDAMTPTFKTMMGSYTIDQAYAAEYVRQGTERLRQMQRQTASMVSRNAEEIRTTMQAAFNERMESQDYIDYQRSNFMREQQDWISEVEGGTIYHTENWGTQNTDTGETWTGRKYDYVHFQGENPKYREDMTPIDSRELWKKHIQGK